MKLLVGLVLFCCIILGMVRAESEIPQSDFLNLNSDKTTRSDNVQQITAGTAKEPCQCVYYYLCNVTDELAFQPLKDSPCGHFLEVCCKKSEIAAKPLSQYFTTTQGPKCGSRNPNGVGSILSIDKDDNGDAKFGEFPWMVAVFIQSSTENLTFHCGGSLIHPQVVLTGAHCVSNKDAKYIIRVGEWDLRNQDEELPHQDRNVKTVIVHSRYKPDVLFNNVALAILETPVIIAPNVDITCLPKQNMRVDGLKCFVSGWGKGVSGRKTAILKKLQLPTIPHSVCQERLRETRLGKYFILDPSFICAGGEPGIDTCKGDGGGPLVCPIPGSTDRYFQAGIVSWGIGCGEEIPAAYANVAMFVDWIDEQLVSHNLDNPYHKY